MLLITDDYFQARYSMYAEKLEKYAETFDLYFAEDD